MARARIYVDVDGVINRFVDDGAWDDDVPGAGTAGVDVYSQYMINWSPKMIEELSSLDADFYWLTTWRDAAPMHIAPLVGIGSDWQVIHPNEDPDARTTFPSIFWKANVINQIQSRDPSPFWWFEDEIRAVDQIMARDLGGLAIRPNSESGISPEDIYFARNYLAKLLVDTPDDVSDTAEQEGDLPS